MRTCRTETPGRTSAADSSGSHGRDMLSQVRAHRWPAASAQPRSCSSPVSSSSSSRVSDTVPLGRDVAGDVGGPAEERGRQRVAARVGGVDHDAQVAAAGGPVVDARPRDERPVGRLDDELAPGPRADADHLAPHEVGVDRPVLGRQRAPEVDERDQGRDVVGERRPRRQALRERGMRVGRLLGEGTVHRVIVPCTGCCGRSPCSRGSWNCSAGRCRVPGRRELRVFRPDILRGERQRSATSEQREAAGRRPRSRVPHRPGSMCAEVDPHYPRCGMRSPPGRASIEGCGLGRLRARDSGGRRGSAAALSRCGAGGAAPPKGGTMKRPSFKPRTGQLPRLATAAEPVAVGRGTASGFFHAGDGTVPGSA